MLDVDLVANALGQWGQKALSMPRGAFEIEGQTHPLLTQDGSRIGKIIPGRGLLLPADLKALGITKNIPGVIERTPFMRLAEAVAGDRGAITSMAALRSASGRQTYVKADTFSQGNGSLVSGQQLDTTNSLQGFNTTQNSALNRLSTVDAYNAQLRDPPAGKTTYLIGVSALNTTSAAGPVSMLAYVDILLTVYNLAGDSASLQTPASVPAITRYTSGVGVYINGTSYAGSMGFTATSDITIGYTNQAGTGGRTATFTTQGIGQSCLLSSNDANTQSTIAFPFQAGDYGARSIVSMQLSSASTTVGAKCGAFLFHPLFFLHAIVEAGTTVERDARAEPETLVDFEVDGSGVLGFHTMLWINGTSSAADTNAVFTFDTCEG